jgi:hypothetical protein
LHNRANSGTARHRSHGLRIHRAFANANDFDKHSSWIFQRTVWWYRQKWNHFSDNKGRSEASIMNWNISEKPALVVRNCTRFAFQGILKHLKRSALVNGKLSKVSNSKLIAA